MLSYLTAFIFYTLAMIGILLIGFIVYKKTAGTTQSVNKGLIKVIDSCSIGNKKSLLVVKVKNERFLIVSGLEHTTFLAKLEENNKEEKVAIQQENIQKFVPEIMPQQEIITPIQEQKMKLDEIQRQLKQMYLQREMQNNIQQSTVNKKDVIRKLLQELNETTNQVQGGYNG